GPCRTPSLRRDGVRARRARRRNRRAGSTSRWSAVHARRPRDRRADRRGVRRVRLEEHTSELQSRFDLVCRLLLEKKKSNPACSRLRNPLRGLRPSPPSSPLFPYTTLFRSAVLAGLPRSAATVFALAVPGAVIAALVRRRAGQRSTRVALVIGVLIAAAFGA